MKKKKKFKVYADLIDSPERLSALIEDRRKRRKVIQICFAVIAVTTFITVISSFGSGGSSASSLAVMAIFFSVILAFEFEWQLLHVLLRLSDKKPNQSQSE